MRYHVAVQVQAPRVSYADICRLDRRHQAERRLVPIRDGQRTAVVRLFLMRERHDGVLEPRRMLHEFRLTGLDRLDDRLPLLTLRVRYDGRRHVRASVQIAGDGVRSADLRVPRGWRTGWLIPIGLLLLAAAIVGVWRALPGPTAPAAAGDMGTADSTRAAGGAGAEAGPNSAGGANSAGGTASSSAAGGAGAEAGTDSAESPVAVPPPTEDAAPSAETEPVVAEPAETPAVDTLGTAARDPAPAAESIDEAVYFRPNRVYITSDARIQLDNLLERLRRDPDARVTIVGHTALFGTEEGRTEISRGRAERVAEYLRREGLGPEADVQVEWMGSRAPVTRDPDEQYRNRRVEITVDPR